MNIKISISVWYLKFVINLIILFAPVIKFIGIKNLDFDVKIKRIRWMERKDNMKLFALPKVKFY